MFAKSYFRYAGPPNGSLADLRMRQRLMQEFEANLRLKASLYYTHGSGDDDLVILHPVGWEEVLQNVKEIYVIPPLQGGKLHVNIGDSYEKLTRSYLYQPNSSSYCAGLVNQTAI